MKTLVLSLITTILLLTPQQSKSDYCSMSGLGGPCSGGSGCGGGGAGSAECDNWPYTCIASTSCVAGCSYSCPR